MHKLSSRSVFQVKFILLEGDKTRNIPKKLSKTSKEKHLNDYRLIALARNFVWVEMNWMMKEPYETNTSQPVVLSIENTTKREWSTLCTNRNGIKLKNPSIKLVIRCEIFSHCSHIS